MAHLNFNISLLLFWGVLWQGFLSAVDTHFNTEPLHDPHDQTSPSSLQIYYYSLGFPQTGRPCVHIFSGKVIVSSVLTSLKEAGGDFSWVNFSFYFIFCGFNGGNTTTFVYRGLQIQQNIKVPCWSFSRTADKNCIFYLVSYADWKWTLLTSVWVSSVRVELTDLNYWTWTETERSMQLQCGILHLPPFNVALHCRQNCEMDLKGRSIYSLISMCRSSSWDVMSWASMDTKYEWKNHRSVKCFVIL